MVYQYIMFVFLYDLDFGVFFFAKCSVVHKFSGSFLTLSGDHLWWSREVEEEVNE